VTDSAAQWELGGLKVKFVTAMRGVKIGQPCGTLSGDRVPNGTRTEVQLQLQSAP